MTPATAELLHHYRRIVRDLDEQLEHLTSGAIRFLRGSRDATEEAIALAKAQRAHLQALVDRHDPDGFTKLL